MDEEIKKDAEEEMNCNLGSARRLVSEIRSGLCKYGRTCKNDQITSWGSVGNQEDFDVYRTKKAPIRGGSL